MSKTIYVDCPFCEGLMEINVETGEIVEKWSAEDRLADSGDKMGAALKKLDDAKKRRKDLFSLKKDELEGQKKKLASTFEQEVKKAKKKGVGDKPFRPFDLD